MWNLNGKGTKSCLRNILVRFDENCTNELAETNQHLLTICSQDPNQLFKGVFPVPRLAAGLTPKSGDYRGLACAYC